MCEQGFSDFSKTMTEDELISLFKRRMDFCLEHNYPSPEFITLNFSRQSLDRGGIFADREIDETRGNGTYVVWGKCSGKIRFRRHTAAILYVCHDSDITIEAGENSKVQVRLYHNAKTRTEGSDEASVTVFDRR